MKTHRLLLLLIFLLAAFLRLYNLETVPPPFNVDEAANAYDAYAMLKTGKDQWGNSFPITFRAFNDYRRPATIYSAVPFLAIFDLTIFGIRAMAAFWGWLAIIFLYRLARDMFSTQTALFAALLLSISLWHVPFSRLGVEVSGPLLTSIIAGMDFVWRWHESQKRLWLVASGIAFALSLYAYTVSQAFTPLILLALLILFWHQFRQNIRITILTGVLIFILISPLAYAVLSNPLSWNRFGKISVLKAPYNETVPLFLAQWLGHFNPAYLFITGDANPIHHPPGSGQLLWFETVTIPMGLLCMISALVGKTLFPVRKLSSSSGMRCIRLPYRACIIVLVWVVLGALPAALTQEDMGSANSMRGIICLPAWTILSAVGLSVLWSALEKAGSSQFLWRVFLLITLTYNAIHVFKYYFVSYPIQHARVFEYGIQQAMEYVLEHEVKYNKIVLTNWISQPHIFAVFFSKYEPYEFQHHHAEYGTKLSEKLVSWGDKYMTGDVDKLYDTINSGLFISRPHMLRDIEPAEIIYHPDGSIAFKIISKQE